MTKWSLSGDFQSFSADDKSFSADDKSFSADDKSFWADDKRLPLHGPRDLKIEAYVGRAHVCGEEWGAGGET